MSLLPFCHWLAETRGSIALHESLYMYPLVESTHVWALAVFVGFTALLDLRLLGLVLRDVPATVVNRRALPWMIAGFIVMVLTGVLLFYAIPVRSYQNIFFRVKVIMLILAGLNVWLFQRGVWRRVEEWDAAARPPRRARLTAMASLVLWACIIFAGRMIAYNWFDCDRQPQPAFINWAIECTPEAE
jgi:hypothetical protein